MTGIENSKCCSKQITATENKQQLQKHGVIWDGYDTSEFFFNLRLLIITQCEELFIFQQPNLFCVCEKNNNTLKITNT